MNTKIILGFLKDLKKNNNREWFHANKSSYDLAKKEFVSFVDLVIAEIRKFDADIPSMTASECMFRINRDIRFSHNKQPYKTNMGAFIAKGGRKSPNAGYYIHLDPEESFLGGGIYMPEAPVLKRIREEVYHNVDEFKEIITSKEFKKYFGKLDFEQKLVRAPKGYDETWPDIDLLKFKSYVVFNGLSEKDLQKPDLLKHTIAVFKAQYPFNRFMNESFATDY